MQELTQFEFSQILLISLLSLRFLSSCIPFSISRVNHLKLNQVSMYHFETTFEPFTFSFEDQPVNLCAYLDFKILSNCYI